MFILRSFIQLSMLLTFDNYFGSTLREQFFLQFCTLLLMIMKNSITFMAYPDMDNIHEHVNGVRGKFSPNGNHEKMFLSCENCLSYT